MASPAHLEELIEQVHARRRQLVVGGVGTLVLGVGTLIGPFLGSIIVSVTLSGSALTGGPLVELGLSDAELSTLVGLGSLLVSGPLCLSMLIGSWFWHGFVHEEAQAAGVVRPALGIAAPARLVGIPLLLGLVLTGVLLPVAWLLPAPESDDILGNALTGAALLAPLLGPLVGLLVGWRLGMDARATALYRQGRLTLDAFEAGQVSAFPLIQRRPRSLVHAELLLAAGRLDRADALIRVYLEQVGVGLHRALLLWSRVHRAAGRLDEAEQALAAAARLVPTNLTPLRALAAVWRERGRTLDAERLEHEIDALRASWFGLLGGRSDAPAEPQRVNA